MKNLKNDLETIQTSARPWAIWIWNGRITVDEVRNQLTSIIENGFGGVAVRPGRDMFPRYLAEDFFECFDEALRLAHEAGIGVRLADDFSLPWSGAFESMTRRNRSFRAQQLQLDALEPLKESSTLTKKIADHTNVIAVAVRLTEENRIDLPSARVMTFASDEDGTISWKVPAGNWHLMILRKKELMDPLNAFLPNCFNGKVAETYAAEVLDTFKRRYMKYVPDTFQGILTEMPSFLPCDNAIPWDDDLAVKYRGRFKKDLAALLPSLFARPESADLKNRCHIYRFILNSAYERFAGPLEKWCRKIRMSQWVLTPERHVYSMPNALINCMAFAPGGFSHVGAQNQEGSLRNPVPLRAVADHNVNEMRRESLTVVGRNRAIESVSLEMMKTEIDRALFTGSSVVLVDGLYFNLDHRSDLRTPYNCFWYSSDWPRMKHLCDYAARVGQLSRNLHFSREVAVLMPTVPMLADYMPGNDEAVRKASQSLERVMNQLHRRGLDFDVVSEELLLSCAVRVNGEFGTADRIRKGNYQALVVPNPRIVSKGVLVFIEKVVARGGKVIFVDEPPQGCLDEGVSVSIKARIDKLGRSKRGTMKIVSARGVGGALEGVDAPAKVQRVQGKPAAGILCCHATDDKHSLYFLHNPSDTEDRYATVQFPFEPHFYFLDCENGEIHEFENVEKDENGHTLLSMSFSPHQTYVVMGCSSKPAGAKAHDTRNPHPVNLIQTRPQSYRVVLRNEWKFTPLCLNVLPLASWNARIGLSRESGGYSHYSEAYFEVRDLPNLCLLLLNGLTHPREREGFTTDSMEISLNGNKVTKMISPVAGGSRDDLPDVVAATPFARKCTAFQIRGLINRGYNRIALRTADFFRDPPAIVYPPLIAGDLTIEKGNRGWVIGKTSPGVKSDSWCEYGYPYFSGLGKYTQVFEVPSDFKRLVLHFTGVSGTMDVAVNGVNMGSYSWAPFELDVTSVCKSKRNQLEVSVANTIDNFLRMNRRRSGVTGKVFLDVY